MIEPEDNRTQNLPIDEAKTPEFPEAQAVLARVKSAEQAERDEKEAFLRDSHALVRVKTPVFVEDPKLAREARAKAMAAARSAEYREKKKTESGLVLAMTPLDVVEQVKKIGWPEFLKTKEVIKTVNVEVPGPVQYVDKLVPGPIEYVEKIVEKIVDKPVPGPVQYIEKIVEKQTLKLTSEQKKSLLLGQKMQALTGFKRFLVQKIVGF